MTRTKGDSPTSYEGAGTGDRRYLIADRQGSVIAAAGATTARSTYGPYGEPDVWTGSRFRYTGQIALPEAQLYHYKARVYDPVLGRFLQTDPIGYDDGLNWYAYVGNDPMDDSDPSGLQGNTCSRVGAASCPGDYSGNGSGTGADADAGNVKGAQPLCLTGTPYEQMQQVAKAANGTQNQFLADAIDETLPKAVDAYVGIETGRFAFGVVRDLSVVSTHGTARLAGAQGARGGSLTGAEALIARAFGARYLQSNGATAYVLRVGPERFNVVIAGNRGLITTIRRVDSKDLAGLARRYGWLPVQSVAGLP